MTSNFIVSVVEVRLDSLDNLGEVGSVTRIHLKLRSNVIETLEFETELEVAAEIFQLWIFLLYHICYHWIGSYSIHHYISVKNIDTKF